MSVFPPWGRGVIVFGVLVILIGVVMAKSHEPVAIKPDAPLADGVAVATFALG